MCESVLDMYLGMCTYVEYLVMIRPRWGVKKRNRFWLLPKKDLLSVGWSFRKGSLRISIIHEGSGVPTQLISRSMWRKDVKKVDKNFLS